MKLKRKFKVLLLALIITTVINVVVINRKSNKINNSVDSKKYGEDVTYEQFSNDMGAFYTWLLNKIYPVGSIYISTNVDTPAKVSQSIGGTWEVFGDGRVLRGTTTAAKVTGGSSTATLAVSNLPAHTHNATAKGSVKSTFTGTAVTSTNQSANLSGSFSGKAGNTSSNNIASHSHRMNGFQVMGGDQPFRLVMQGDGNLVEYIKGGGAVWNIGTHSGAGAVGDWHAVSINQGNTGTTSNNTTHSHVYKPEGKITLSGNHTHNATAKGTVSSSFSGTAVASTSTGSGTAFSIVDPYITVHMFIRTA